MGNCTNCCGATQSEKFMNDGQLSIDSYRPNRKDLQKSLESQRYAKRGFYHSFVQPEEVTDPNIISQHGPPAELAHQVEEFPIPDIHIYSINEKLGEFKFDNDSEEDSKLPYLPPMQFIENKAIYKGQWKNGLRHGRGEQYWPDGSYYI